MKSKLSQKQICFLYLLSRPGEKIPVYDFVGEKTILGTDYFLSYKATTRMSEMFKDLQFKGLNRDIITGPSGAKYFRYWLEKNENTDTISSYYQNVNLEKFQELLNK